MHKIDFQVTNNAVEKPKDYHVIVDLLGLVVFNKWMRLSESVSDEATSLFLELKVLSICTTHVW